MTRRCSPCPLRRGSVRSHFYVVSNLGAIKFGSTNEPGNRLPVLRSQHWLTDTVRLFEVADAREIECGLHHRLAELGVRPIKGLEYFARAAAEGAVLAYVDAHPMVVAGASLLEADDTPAAAS